MITGANGQLGKRLSAGALEQSDWLVKMCDRTVLDLTDADEIQRVVKGFNPDLVINAAAYTAVDRAEQESDIAFDVNAIGVKNLAEACAPTGIDMVHVSTDYVFDGLSNAPYQPDDLPNPTGVYGRSKLEGERILAEIYAASKSGAAYWIFRSSWLYDSVGQNFLCTMLRLGREQSQLQVVSDQWGAPTFVKHLSAIILEHAASPKRLAAGIYHYGPVGPASWFEFAQKIFELTGSTVAVVPCSTVEYSTPSKRPAYSYLDPYPLMKKLDRQPEHWVDQLRDCLEEAGLMRAS